MSSGDRRRQGSRALAAIAFVAASTTAAAANAGPRDPLSWLDTDAPVVAAVDPVAMPGLLGALGLDESALVARVTKAVAAPSPSDAANALASVGIDPRRPVAISVGAIDGPSSSALFEELAAARVWNDQLFRELTKTYWRSRAVVPVADRARARAAVERIAGATETLLSVATDEARSIAMVFGAHPKRADTAVRALRKRGVLALGWHRGSRMLIAVRLPAAGGVLVIDAIRPFGGVPIVWERNRRDVFGLLDRVPGTGDMGRRLEPGPGAGPALRLWLRAEPSLTAVGALARRQILFAVADADRDRGKRRALVDAGRQQMAACKRFSSLAGRGGLRSLAFAVDAGSEAVEIDIRGARRETRTPVSARDDGLWAALDGADWTVALQSASLADARRTARPDILRNPADLSEAAAACGAGATLATMAFGGPGLAFLAADSLADRKAMAKFTGKARNAAWFRADGGEAAVVSLPRQLRRRARKAARNNPRARTFSLAKGVALAIGDPATLAWLSPASKKGTDDGGDSTGEDDLAQADDDDAAGDVAPLLRFAVRSRDDAPAWLARLLGPLWRRTAAIEGSFEVRREVRGRVRLALRPR